MKMVVEVRFAHQAELLVRLPVLAMRAKVVAAATEVAAIADRFAHGG